MRLTCPCCGALASLEAWAGDAEARLTMAAIAKLPQPVAGSAPAYLGLFRPATRALGWKKAMALLTQLAALVGQGYVSVQGRVDRDCPPELWARGMDEMVARRDRLSRPLANHNYLRQVVSDLAEQDDRGRERTVVTAEREHRRPDQGPVATVPLYAKLMEDAQ